MLKQFKIITLLFVLAILATSVSAGGGHFRGGSLNTCAISTGHGLLQDFDCDRVPDIADNCFQVFNPSQLDSNHNGVGDLCDVKIHARSHGFVMLKIQDVQAPPQPSGVPESQIQIDIKDIQDVYVGTSGAVYPMKITNNGENAERVVFEVKGIKFGTYRIDPSPVMIIQSGQTETAYLHLMANDDAEEAVYPFKLMISTDDSKEVVNMEANVFDGPTKSHSLQWGEIIGWILVVIVILILILIAGKEFQKNGGKSRQLDKDIYSYY